MANLLKIFQTFNENSTFLILIEKKKYEFYEQRSKPTAW